MKSNLVDVSVQFQHQTEKAICFRDEEDGDDLWIPKSQCEMLQTDPVRGHYVLLTMSESTAIEKGLV